MNKIFYIYTPSITVYEEICIYTKFFKCNSSLKCNISTCTKNNRKKKLKTDLKFVIRTC